MVHAEAIGEFGLGQAEVLALFDDLYCDAGRSFEYF